MLTFVRGNLFESPAKVLVNTVNTVGVMGKGIALTFKQTYPEMFRRYQTLCERKEIPFEKVYHDTWISDDERDVVFRRCAEVLVPNELGLTHLKHVFCRSPAEYETLYSLLDRDTRKSFKGRIGVSAALHFKKWTYLESVELTRSRVHFRFSPSTQTPGPFRVQFSVSDLGGGLLGTWRSNSYLANEQLVINLHEELAEYVAELHLDDALAYRNTFTSQDALL